MISSYREPSEECYAGQRWRDREARNREHGFTLVEMLIAMAITLVMMGAVATLFANISSSVRNRRATIEMSIQLRHVRNVLQQDLQGATCPAVTWQRSESNHGYIELIEGPHKEGYASDLLDEDPYAPPTRGTNPPVPNNPEIDHHASTLPCSNLPFKDPAWATDGGGLGDFDDVIMLTSRNEHEPFVGRIPSMVRPNNTSANTFDQWGNQSIQSPLAEVIWFAVENPGYTSTSYPDPDPTGKHFFGEPGYRTIYRRTLLVAPWLNPYRYTDPRGNIADTFTYDGGTFKAQPGLLRILPGGKNLAVPQAIAALVAFQDRYDISARLEWDCSIQRWKIVANTLGDLTKRENRFQHFGYRPVPTHGTARAAGREFPFSFISSGSDYRSGSSLTEPVLLVTDPEGNLAPIAAAKATAQMWGGTVAEFSIDSPGVGYKVRPFACVNDDCTSMATARVMLNDEGQVVRLLFGPAPLWGERRGEDVMMTDVLAFDLRVYDPGAPIFATRKSPGSSSNFDVDVVLEPSAPGWRGASPDGAGGAYFDNDHIRAAGDGRIGNGNTRFVFVGLGAYVDMGYGYDKEFRIDYSHVPWPYTPVFPKPQYAPAFASSADSWFFSRHGIRDIYDTDLTPGYCVYDTWSFHYENNGVNDDGYYFNGEWNWYDAARRKWINTPGLFWTEPIDQGTDGLDNDGRLGVDDANERETRPPYDHPLRGIQLLLRAYERDSRAIRQVRVTQHFMPE